MMGVALWANSAGAAESAQNAELDLAKQLANPIASLYTLPFQMNFDRGLGPDGNGSRYQLNVQPLIPFSLNKDWNLISRTIIPFISQEDVNAKGHHESGMGDILESLFFSPSKTPKHGWIWGVGPAISLPTATNDAFGGDTWALDILCAPLRHHDIDQRRNRL